MTGAVVRARDAGFTLVETLVAFAILSLVLVAAFSGVHTALRAEDRADFERVAVTLARSKLEALGIVDALAPGTTHGSFDNGLAWSLSIRPYDDGARPPTRLRVPGYWAEIAVSRPGPGGTVQRMTLSTLKLGPATTR